MCSYSDKIQPRPHDHQLAYVGDAPNGVNGSSSTAPVTASVQIGSPDGSSSMVPVTASPTNPDFLGIATLKNR
ncbi:hypothetical protein ACFX13_007408 [Malus domestica]